MDALPIVEENDVPYRSQHPGAMHACGHDCHTSILLGVAKKLTQEPGVLRGDVSLCFQPAEENGGGAVAMIQDGALAKPKPDAAFGLHVWQDLDLGKVGVTSGPFMAAVDEFDVTVHWQGRARGSARDGDRPGGVPGAHGDRAPDHREPRDQSAARGGGDASTRSTPATPSTSSRRAPP